MINSSLNKWQIQIENMEIQASKSGYILTLNVNGGQRLPKNKFEMTFSESIYSLPVPKRIGYEFLGWFSLSDGGTAYTDRNGKSYQTWREDGDRTFYAHWEAKECEVKLNVYHSIYDKRLLTYNQDYNLPIPTQMTGYNFNGWYSSGTGGTAYTDADGKSLKAWKEATNSKTLYAHWEPQKYTITLIWDNDTDPIYAIKEVTYGEGYYLTKAPDSPKFKFLGWFNSEGVAYTDSNGCCFEVFHETQDITLCAHWRRY